MCMCLKNHLNAKERKQDKCPLETPLDFEEGVFDDEVQQNEAIPLSDEEIALDATKRSHSNRNRFFPNRFRLGRIEFQRVGTREVFVNRCVMCDHIPFTLNAHELSMMHSHISVRGADEQPNCKDLQAQQDQALY
ncbi:hypothetical protein Tco_1542632 [Tanacetum coccineum]